MSLDRPILNVFLETQSNQWFRVGQAECQGYRDTMEDKMDVQLEGNIGFFGVYDGHGGDLTAKYLKENLGATCLQNMNLDTDDSEIFEEIFQDMDREAIENCHLSGSTCACIYAHHRKDQDQVDLILMHLGDSRVIVFDDTGQLVHETSDHKPEDEAEELRIKKLGGKVINNRVNGMLAMSRAFGDAFFKQGMKKGNKQLVECEPTIKRMTIPANYTIALCCDGFFERQNWSTPNICKFLTRKITKHYPDLSKAAHCAIKKSILKKHSHDNHSMMIVQFQHGPQMFKDDSSVDIMIDASCKFSQEDGKFTHCFLKNLATYGIDVAQFLQHHDGHLENMEGDTRAEKYLALVSSIYDEHFEHVNYDKDVFPKEKSSFQENEHSIDDIDIM